MVSRVFSRLLYSAETWTIKAADSRKPLAFETRCYRGTLKVRWKYNVYNKIIKDSAGRRIIVEITKQKADYCSGTPRVWKICD